MAAPAPVYDAIIVGCGIMGLSAAWRMAKSGLSVLALEQHALLHKQGSSHGMSRIIRRTYVEDYYIPMVDRSYALWEEAQKESRINVYTKTGSLDFAPQEDANLNTLKRACQASGVPLQTLTTDEVARRFRITLPSNYAALHQADGGILNADLSMSMMLHLSLRHGAVVRDHERVVDVTTQGDYRVVHTSKGSHRARKVIITAGPWVTDFTKLGFALPPMEKWKITYAYFPVRQGVSDAVIKQLSAPDMPVFIEYRADNLNVAYGFPINEIPRCIKVALHHSNDPHTDPDAVRAPDAIELGRLQEWLKKHFKDVDATAPVKVETCIYTMAPQEKFIIDHLPHDPAIWLASPCSGHGFKMGPIIGEILSQIVSKGEYTELDIVPFKLPPPVIKSRL